MVAKTTKDVLPQQMRQLQTLAKSGQREQFADYCRELLRQYARDTEALMRLARFCQKQKWHAGFELFMLRLAERLPGSRPGILVTLGQYLLSHGIHRGLNHLRTACAALADDGPDAEAVETGGAEDAGGGTEAAEKRKELRERALAAAAAHLSHRNDWEEVVKTFPEQLQGDLYLELAARWGTDRPADAFRAYRRALRARPDVWPGRPLADVALAYATTLASGDAAAAINALLWAADYVDDPRLESEAAAVALEAGDEKEALRLSRRVFQRHPDDLDNLGRLVGLQAGAGAWGQVASLAQAVVAAVARLNPWQREDYVPVVDLALEAWLRTGQAGQAEAALRQLHIDDAWEAAWRRRIDEAKAGR